MEAHKNNHKNQFLLAKRLGIDTRQEPVIYLREDSPVCRSEGFEAHSRVLVCFEKRQVIATLNVVYNHLLKKGEAGFSESAWKLLNLLDGSLVRVSHAPQLESFTFVRSKIYGNTLSKNAFLNIITDISAGKYSDVHLSAFVSACGGDRLNTGEIISITKAMVEVGEKIVWEGSPIVDKHCIGGLPGNRTTPIVVSIVASLGLIVPKTSSRAITSPAGTADMMEVLTNVDLKLSEMKNVVNQEGGCLAWGGNVGLSPADDILIRIEKALDLDSKGQLVASVLSKKVAAGSTHVLIDIPWGKTAKVRSLKQAQGLSRVFVEVGKKLGLVIKCLITDGSQPIGYGIGPALEAHDVLGVLQNKKNAPQDLKERALLLASKIIEMSEKFPHGRGLALARKTLESGAAFEKFSKICMAQGGFKIPGLAPHSYDVVASKSGVVTSIDNRFLARAAKLAGAPKAGLAGIKMAVRLADKVKKGDPLFTVYSESTGELAYSLEYIQSHPGIVTLEVQ